MHAAEIDQSIMAIDQGSKHVCRESVHSVSHRVTLGRSAPGLYTVDALIVDHRIHPKTVQGLLQHADIKTTLGLYTQDKSDEKQAVQGAFLMRWGLQAQCFSRNYGTDYGLSLSVPYEAKSLTLYGGDDGARTRDLCRDRAESTSKTQRSENLQTLISYTKYTGYRIALEDSFATIRTKVPWFAYESLRKV